LKDGWFRVLQTGLMPTKRPDISFRRIESLELPFDLADAANGGKVECLVEDYFEDCDFVQVNSDADISVMCGDTWIHQVDFKRLRMKESRLKTTGANKK
jgi:hypothetical protein